MKFGVREICDVVLKAKFPHKVGNKMFYRNEPVMFFDSLKTSSMEGASTTVYAQGGRGNARLVAWEGDRTVTFTMEDALISPESFSILAGADLMTLGEKQKTKQHIVETVPVYFDSTGDTVTYAQLKLTKEPVYDTTADHLFPICVMGKDDYDNIITEPFYAQPLGDSDSILTGHPELGTDTKHIVKIGPSINYLASEDYKASGSGLKKWRDHGNDAATYGTIMDTEADSSYYALVDYYTEVSAGQVIEITPDKFGGNYYLEASTLFRDSSNGKDYPAEFIIPNCKIQSNFTFNMANSGDPSTFTFTIDAFPDYTKFDRTKKVFAAIQIIDDLASSGEADLRPATPYNA